MRRLRITVTQRHQDRAQAVRGAVNRSYTCPIAMAFRDRGYQNVRVGVHTVSLDGYCTSLPPRAQDLILTTDIGTRPIHFPVTFYVSLDNPTDLS